MVTAKRSWEAFPSEGLVEYAGEGRPGQLLAVVGVGDEVAPPPGDALAAAGGLVGHERDDLDQEVVREIGHGAPLDVPLLLLAAARRHQSAASLQIGTDDGRLEIRAPASQLGRDQAEYRWSRNGQEGLCARRRRGHRGGAGKPKRKGVSRSYEYIKD